MPKTSCHQYLKNKDKSTIVTCKQEFICCLYLLCSLRLERTKVANSGSILFHCYRDDTISYIQHHNSKHTSHFNHSPFATEYLHSHFKHQVPLHLPNAWHYQLSFNCHFQTNPGQLVCTWYSSSICFGKESRHISGRNLFYRRDTLLVA